MRITFFARTFRYRTGSSLNSIPQQKAKAVTCSHDILSHNKESEKIRTMAQMCETLFARPRLGLWQWLRIRIRWYVFGPPGSGSVSQRYVQIRILLSSKSSNKNSTADPDPLARDTDPCQNVTDPQHWLWDGKTEWKGNGHVSVRFIFLLVFISQLKPVLRIRPRIHRIHIFLGLLDPDPYIIKQ
jgi:hypothetical protein